MAWFWQGTKSGNWDLATVERPWHGGTSIYEHVVRHIALGVPGLTAGGDRLPDEQEEGGIEWVAGGADGALGHHGGAGPDPGRVRMLHRALGVVLQDPSSTKLRKLYEQLVQAGALEIVDALLTRIVDRHDLDLERLEQLAIWIAKNAPDREPVKLAIALLGLFPGADHGELLLALGRHEEFTLFVAVALSNVGGEAAERLLFRLAQNVSGWGRIHLVERLAETRNPTIKAWMLREGYKNSVMYEYLAHTCAVAGGLRSELERDRVDAELLAGAGEIIQALVAGGPAEDMDDYADGAIVVERYLYHLGAEPDQLEQLITIDSI